MNGGSGLKIGRSSWRKMKIGNRLSTCNLKHELEVSKIDYKFCVSRKRMSLKLIWLKKFWNIVCDIIWSEERFVELCIVEQFHKTLDRNRKNALLKMEFSHYIFLAFNFLSVHFTTYYQILNLVSISSILHQFAVPFQMKTASACICSLIHGT